MTKRTDKNQTWDADGNLVSEETVEVDITEEVASAGRRTDLRQAVTVLRTWSNMADAHVVTNNNAVATVQAINDRFGVFCGRFADLLVEQYGDES